MVSAFDVYLVMQLDSIRDALVVAAFLFGILGHVVFGVGVMSSADGEEWGPAVRKIGIRTVAAGVVAAIGVALVPSSKTAAAMILVPALTSKEVTEPLSREAGELYGLAKDALRSIAEKPKDKPAAAE